MFVKEIITVLVTHILYIFFFSMI